MSRAAEAEAKVASAGREHTAIPVRARQCTQAGTMRINRSFLVLATFPKLTRCALGLDVGGANSVVATARQGGVDVLVNEASCRQTPSMVAFDERRRLLGQGAASQQASSPANCVAEIKALIGLSLEAARNSQPQPSASIVEAKGKGGGCLIEVRLRGEVRRFSATQLLAMLLHQLQRCAELEIGAAASSECTIAVPLHFTPSKRQAVLDAAAVAGLRGTRLISDGAAVALDYALGRPGLPADEDHLVAFVDAGYAGVQICIVAIRRDSLRLLSHAFAPGTGGAVRLPCARTTRATSCLCRSTHKPRSAP